MTYISLEISDGKLLTYLTLEILDGKLLAYFTLEISDWKLMEFEIKFENSNSHIEWRNSGHHLNQTNNE